MFLVSHMMMMMMMMMTTMMMIMMMTTMIMLPFTDDGDDNDAMSRLLLEYGHFHMTVKENRQTNNYMH